MATRSTIAIKNSDGSVESIYCHWDGASNGEILNKNYSTEELARELISNGNASFLAEKISPTGPHSFSSPQPGVCVFYGRDRKETGQAAKRHYGVEDWLRHGEQYNYLFQDGAWYLVLGPTRIIKL